MSMKWALIPQLLRNLWPEYSLGCGYASHAVDRRAVLDFSSQQSGRMSSSYADLMDNDVLKIRLFRWHKVRFNIGITRPKSMVHLYDSVITPTSTFCHDGIRVPFEYLVPHQYLSPARVDSFCSLEAAGHGDGN